MSGTSQGYVKTRAKLVDKLGSEEAYMAWKRSSASKGGKNGNTGGYASDVVGKDGLTGLERAVIAGRKGGTISRRKSKKIIIA